MSEVKIEPALGRLEAKMLAQGSSAVSTGDNLAFKLLPNGRLMARVAASAVHKNGMHEITDHRHGLAALCLHGQPFGFTREDVEELRDLSAEYGSSSGIDSTYGPLEDIADRIEALLPPEATDDR